MKLFGSICGNGWDLRQSGDGDLDPGRGDYGENRNRSPYQDGRSNPDTKAAIRRIMNGFMSRIE